MRYRKGFTVIELLVSTGIMLLIMGVVLANYPSFRARTSLSSVAREIGLLIREAQVYGLAVKRFSLSDKTYPPYGIHLNNTNSKEIVMFGDLMPGGETEGVYDSGDGCGGKETECIRRLTINGAVNIIKFCVLEGGGDGYTAEEICNISQLNISFRRPDPEAFIIVNDSSRRYNGANIYLQSNREPAEERVIRVWVTGQISVQ